MQDSRLPQWVRSRLKAVSKKKDCGVTHGICKCFLEKLIALEAEVSALREALRETAKKCPDSDPTT